MPFLMEVEYAVKKIIRAIEKRKKSYAFPWQLATIVRQALIFSGLGFIPAFFFALLLYFLLRTQAMVPVTMEPTRVIGVFLLTSVMCVSATFLAIRKVRGADPAELF